MDQERVGAMSRALASGVSRRPGLAAALAVVLGGASLDAAATGGGKDKGRGRRKPGVEGPCGDGSRKANICRKDKDCCTGYCNMAVGKKNKDGSGRCRCIRKGKTCTPSQTCCNGLPCVAGVCGSAPPPPPPTCAGTGTYDPTVSGLSSPVGAAVLGGKVYNSNYGASKVVSFNTDGTGIMESPTADSGTQGLAVNPADSKLYLAIFGGAIAEVDATTLAISSSRWASGLCSSAYGLVFGADGKAWLTCNQSNDLYHVSQGDTSGSPAVTGVCTGAGPRGIAFGPGGLLYFACDTSGEVVVVDPATSAKLTQSVLVSSAFGVTFADSQMYVTQFSATKISRYCVTVDNGAPQFDLMCEYPLDAGANPAFSAFDAAGKLWIADLGRNAMFGAILT
ncbi:MAG: hypothetical protein ACKOWF_17390 [Chloroflexota bacterium]